MLIQDARPEDFPFVHRMIEMLISEKVDAVKSEEIYRANLNQPDIYYKIGWCDEQPAVFASLHIQKLLHHTAEVAEVQEMCVAPEFQGRKLGPVMLNHLSEIAESRGCDLIELSSNKKNVRAHKFYDEQGWKQSHFKYTHKWGRDKEAK